MVKDFFWKKNIIYENGDCMVSQIVEAEKYDFNGHVYSLKSDTIDELCLDLFMETSDRLENSKADLKKIGKIFDSIAKKNNKKMLLDIESSGRKQEWDYNRKIEKSNLIRMVTIDGNSRCKYVDIPLTFDIDVLMSVMEKEFLNLIEEDTYKIIDKILPISDVILKPRAAAYFIHEIIGHPLEYDFIKANRSFFEEKKINQMVLPSFVTIKECPEKATQIGIDFDCIDDSEKK